MLADESSADELFERALAGAAHRYPWHLARLQLAQGAWLRRHRRLTESREPLRTARETFAALGAGTWADRSDQELRASGETGWRPVASPREQLSTQEAQIARMAVAGRTNPEIAAVMFLSPRTVEWHLRKIYTKLAITSRRELAGALADR